MVAAVGGRGGEAREERDDERGDRLGRTIRVQLVREEGRGVSSQYGREGGGRRRSPRWTWTASHDRRRGRETRWRTRPPCGARTARLGRRARAARAACAAAARRRCPPSRAPRRGRRCTCSTRPAAGPSAVAKQSGYEQNDHESCNGQRARSTQHAARSTQRTAAVRVADTERKRARALVRHLTARNASSRATSRSAAPRSADPAAHRGV